MRPLPIANNIIAQLTETILFDTNKIKFVPKIMLPIITNFSSEYILDPPYSPESITAYFTSYTSFGFDNNQDQQELATVFRKLDDRGCKLLLTNSDTPLIRILYSGYPIVEVDDTESAINCNGSKRAGDKDLIIYNCSTDKQ